jgi:hypothetical protein
MNWRNSLPLAKFLLTQPRLALGRREYIFLISHMRSYSSLLGHLLGSHPEIDGYFEIPVNYTRAADFLRARQYIYAAARGKSGGRYLFDKKLHNRWDPPERFFGRAGFHFLFVLRQPEASVRSIFSMRNHLRAWGHDESPAGAAEYYIDRLATIARLAGLAGGRGAFLPAERIVDDAPGALSGLAGWLGLASPLEPRYNRFALTGMPGRGDPSEVIRRGEIVREGEKYANIVIPPDLLAAAQRAYDACLSACLQNLPPI